MKHHNKQAGKISIPGIKKIWSVDGDRLQSSIMYLSMVGMPVAVNTDLLEVVFSGMPTLEISTSVINGRFFESTTFKFHCPTDKPTLFRHTCWVIETVKGDCLLLGNRESRWPLISQNKSVGTLESARGTTFTITHQAQSSVAEVLL